MAISIEAEMESPNGGIPMWIPRLADILAEHGVEQYVEKSIVDVEQYQDKLKKTHLYFLLSGVKSIDPTELAAAVEPLREYPRRLHELDALWSEKSGALERSIADWRITAENARTQILAWEKWAAAAEAAARKRDISWPWSGLTLNFRVMYELIGATSALSSPQELARNLNFFSGKIAAIQAVVERSYVNGVFDVELSPADLNEAISKLLDKQSEVNACEVLVEEIKVERDELNRSYSTKRNVLVQLLWRMPKTAHVALFWLSRPDLEYPSLQSA